MLRDPKKILLAVAQWVEGEIEDSSRSAWIFEDEIVRLPIVGMAIELWQKYRRGILPRPGGWLDQPLRLISIIEALDLVFLTKQQQKAEDFDMRQLSATQRALLSWSEKELSHG